MQRTYTIDEIRSRLLPVFEHAPVYQAVLFGSYAEGRATPSSDVDIVIDSHGELLNLMFFGVLEDLVERLGKPVDLIERSEIRSPSPIQESILAHGVVLYERPG